jgi:GTP-binding protein
VKHNFVDYVKIYFRSGKGGDGCVSWRREKHVPLGGPTGGDGGRGGNVVLRGNRQLWTLLDLKYRKHIHAPNGQQGSGNRMTGRDGEDVVLEVPLGTAIRDAETDEYVGEVVEHGQELVLLRGGRGGLGNWHFRTATNQAPEYAQKGESGEERTLVLELKVLADVGLVGFPNAGKSTLLAATTAAKPAIADYPFTTLIPNLGIVRHRDYRTFVMADIPGIIEGAHQGKGLGVKFLRHIERNAVLLFLVPISADDVAAEYDILRRELGAYDPLLAHKPHLLVLSKCDVLEESERDKAIHKATKKLPKGTEWVAISAVTGWNLPTLLDRVWALVQAEREADAALPRPWEE